MTITSAGPKCDVCGKFILPIDSEERVNIFGMNLIKNDMHADNKCWKILQESGGDWTIIPDGPLKSALKETMKKATPDRIFQCLAESGIPFQLCTNIRGEFIYDLETHENDKYVKSYGGTSKDINEVSKHLTQLAIRHWPSSRFYRAMSD